MKKRNSWGGLQVRAPVFENWIAAPGGGEFRPPGLVGDVSKEQTPLPLLPEPHPLDFTADVSVFGIGTPELKPVWI
jgi:hypothetical protein